MTTHSYKGYDIPVHLIEKTGAGPETFDVFAAVHMAQLDRFTPLDASHRVLEIGCGIGRDAIPLTERLSGEGSYIGVDIDAESIAWCNANIARKHPCFRFHYLDVKSPLYNPGGKLATTEIRLPASDAGVDRIIAQSVFTHLFEWDAVHYLSEFRRVLRAGGLVLATFFVATEEEVERSKSNPVDFFQFHHAHGDGCYINDRENPEGSVAYTPEALDRLLAQSGLALAQPVQLGHWLPRDGAGDNGQDLVILKLAP